jgi:SpoVK/Ycf46/Vps4 family AAA+-type ATPase
VFLPHTRKDALTWDYLAGYEKVKRDIEDTCLLALTNGDVYDKITALTRMKNETNRPKCVLFEGPPGCGKTTSAKIISQQVEIPLVYMPLEAIMSKYYGESESRLAEIFEASAAMGSVIVFIDEIDSLATSREAGLHEATRRILSTLLRKIDSFESEGEVLVICATNRKKDLDPALISRIDLSVRFDLPDAPTRSQIFQRYAKQLSESDLKELGELAVDLSGRDISDICKDAERKWASKYIRKEVNSLSPSKEIYIEATKNRLLQIKGINMQMDADFNPHLIAQKLKGNPIVTGNS